MPWKPATIITLRLANSARIAVSSMASMRALVKALSVRIATCAPVIDFAPKPHFCKAIANRAIVTCSPVDTIWSSSRGSGSSVMAFASAKRRLVSPLIADTTTTIS